MSPRRIQRKRTAGWKVPLCSCGCGKPAVYVGRPTPWGNPFVARVIFCGPTIRELHTTAETVRAYRDLLTRAVVHPSCWDRKFIDARQHADESIAQLTGHDLMCWCPLDQPCHADVLLELANPEPDLFDGAFPDPEPATQDQPPAGLGKDAQRTWRQKRLLQQDIHPATKVMLIEHDPAIEPTPPSCGGCAHLYLKNPGRRTFWKCSKAGRGTLDGPDMRKSWPACILYDPKELS